MRTIDKQIVAALTFAVQKCTHTILVHKTSTGCVDSNCICYQQLFRQITQWNEPDVVVHGMDAAGMG